MTVQTLDDLRKGIVYKIGREHFILAGNGFHQEGNTRATNIHVISGDRGYRVGSITDTTCKSYPITVNKEATRKYFLSKLKEWLQ